MHGMPPLVIQFGEWGTSDIETSIVHGDIEPTVDCESCRHHRANRIGVADVHHHTGSGATVFHDPGSHIAGGCPIDVSNHYVSAGRGEPY